MMPVIHLPGVLSTGMRSAYVGRVCAGPDAVSRAGMGAAFHVVQVVNGIYGVPSPDGMLRA